MGIRCRGLEKLLMDARTARLLDTVEAPLKRDAVPGRGAGNVGNRGLVELEDYFTSMCADLSDCRFEYLDEVVGERSAYIKWMMHFKHPRLGNRLISVRGVSHLKLGEKIEYHEDFYDMGAMLYDQLPLLGNVTRWLKMRLAG